jgi:hypothetical protein
MWFKSKLLPATVLVAAAGALATNQAQAFGNDEAAILVGVAVGGLTTYALQNANRDRHHHHHYYGGGGGYEYYERREYREPPRRHHHHHHHHHHKTKRVEHYVIHNPPQYRERGYERVSHRGHRRGGYEYEYEYSRRGAF